MKNPKPIIINRRLFMAWVDGALLIRDSRGRCLVTDNAQTQKRCKIAEKAMDRGETLYLTNDAGRVITQMALEGDGYVETEISP